MGNLETGLEYAIIVTLAALLGYGFSQFLAFRAVASRLEEARQQLHREGVLRLRADGQPRRVQRPAKKRLEGDQWREEIDRYRLRLETALNAYRDAERRASAIIFRGFVTFFLMTLAASSALLFVIEWRLGPEENLRAAGSLLWASFAAQLPGGASDAELQSVAPPLGRFALAIHSKILATLGLSIPVFLFQRWRAPKLFEDSLAEIREHLRKIEKNSEAFKEELLRANYGGAFSDLLGAIRRALGFGGERILLEA